MKKLWTKIKNFFIWIFNQLKDAKNIIIFIVVFIIMASEIWVPYLLAIITGNAWWWGIGSACWAFWLGPFTPFFPICIGLTLAVRKLFDVITGKNKKEKKDNEDLNCEKSEKSEDATKEINNKNVSENNPNVECINNEKKD